MGIYVTAKAPVFVEDRGVFLLIGWKVLATRPADNALPWSRSGIPGAVCRSDSKAPNCRSMRIYSRVFCSEIP